MRKNYIKQLPFPVCVVGADGNIASANSFIKNVFVYEDIVGSNFFALTGVKRESLLTANTEEIIIERNKRLFKLWTNENPKEDDDIIVFFDETTARESFRTRLEADKAVIIYINIDNYDDMVASTSEDSRRVIPAQIDGIVKKWGASYDSPVISTGEEGYVMYSSFGKLVKMADDNFSVLDEVRKIESKIDFPASISIGAGVSDVSLMESTELAEAALELATGRGGDQAVVKTDEGTRYFGGTLQAIEKSNRGKARVIAHAMRAMINDADKVLIMGHRWPDIDRKSVV